MHVLYVLYMMPFARSAIAGPPIRGPREIYPLIQFRAIAHSHPSPIQVASDTGS